MKKFGFMILVGGLLVFALTGCGKAKDNAGQGAAGGEAGNAQQAVTVDVADATELLTKVWSSYEEAERFPSSGGDFDNIVSDAPGKFDVSKAEDLDAVLGLPQDSAKLIDDAASLMHMMNANTFTAGAYHLQDGAQLQTLADALKDNIMNRQWMCGFPDTLIVASVGNEYVVSAFGNAEVIETFKTKLSEQYEAAKIIYEESLAQ